MSVFKYDSPVFKKKLLIRAGLVVSIFVIFIGISFFQVELDKRSGFLSAYSLLSGVLILILLKNYRKQLKILEGAKVELDSSSLKQWNAKGQCMEFEYRDLESIEKDRFRGYERILLISKQGTYIPILNIENMDQFLSELEKKSGKKAKVFEEDTKVLSWKTLIAFIPSIGAAIAFVSGYWKEKQDALFIVFALNTLLFLIYFPKDRMDTGYSARRRYIFIVVVVLITLIARYFGWVNFG